MPGWSKDIDFCLKKTLAISANGAPPKIRNRDRLSGLRFGLADQCRVECHARFVLIELLRFDSGFDAGYILSQFFASLPLLECG
jgi:hypothetical protein